MSPPADGAPPGRAAGVTGGSATTGVRHVLTGGRRATGGWGPTGARAGSEYRHRWTVRGYAHAIPRPAGCGGGCYRRGRVGDHRRCVAWCRSTLERGVALARRWGQAGRSAATGHAVPPAPPLAPGAARLPAPGYRLGVAAAATGRGGTASARRASTSP